MSTTHDLPPAPGPAPVPPAADDPLAPVRVGAYRVTTVIGRGGMGVVYRAEQEHPERTVALKMLPPERDTPALRRRFEHETAVLARLSHPGIARIFSAGVADAAEGGRPYFAMELVDGRPLTEFADGHGLDARGRVGLVLQLCDAVQHAHQQGVVHRDLKPGNVLVDPDGRVKVLDFGVAKLVAGDSAEAPGETRVGDVVGTLEYMSPEQAAGRADEVDTRADVYAVGVILYQLLAGRLPFDFAARPVAARLDAVINEEPAPLGTTDRSLRGDLETIIAKAMEKDRDRRYPSVSELAADLRRYLADEPVLARPASAWYLLTKFARRRRSLVAGTALALAALVAAAVVSSLFWLGEREERKRKEVAERQAEEAERATRELLIDTAGRRGDWRGVAAAVDRALGTGHPDTPRLRLHQIRALHALGDPRAAAVAEALAARPDLAPDERAECDLWRGDILLLRREDEGRDYLKRALSGPLRQPDRDYAEGVLAESFRHAHDRLRAALAAEPFHHGARAHLAYLLVFSGRWEEAEKMIDTGGAMFPDDPNFLILRVLLASLRGDKDSLEAAVGRVRAVLGEEAGEGVALAATALRTAFDVQGAGGQLDVFRVMQLHALFARLKETMGQAGGEAVPLRGTLLPPVFEKNFKLLGQVFQRLREKEYADELGAAANTWPDTILYKAWGDCLMVQGRFAEAAGAYEAGLSAHTMFPAVVEGVRLSHVQVLWMLMGGANPEAKKRMRAKVLDGVRELCARYSGPNAAALLRPAPPNQTVGYALVRIALESNEHDLARAALAEWRRVAPQDPVMHALSALIDFFGEAYGPAVTSAREAQKLGLKHPILSNEMGLILREAPNRLSRAAEKYPAEKPKDQTP